MRLAATRGRQAASTLIALGRTTTPIGAALMLDALSMSPLGSLARRTAVEGVLAIIDAFPGSARVLAQRPRKRAPFTIDDEYDVQDPFHALVLPAVPDIVDEHPTGKLAGKSSRLDFTSKSTRLGIELKHVRRQEDVRRIREEILLDERTSQEHPYVSVVIAFVYDPERHIPEHEVAAFEADVSKAVSVGGRRPVHHPRSLTPSERPCNRGG